VSSIGRAPSASVRSTVLESGHERVRVGRWRHDSDVAVLSPSPETPMPSTAFLLRGLDTLARDGYSAVVTAALTVPEQLAYLAAGFEEQEWLRLLTHDLRELPAMPDAPLRRALDGDRSAVLAVDAAAFSSFWQLDEWSLQDALEATPVARFRVVTGRSDEVVGYAISGRTQKRGYLQRLAVDPAWQGRGFGSALVLDGLRWMRRRGVDRAVVNTQLDNRAARGLYLRLGFREEPEGLAVLRHDLR
jgi:ribosomal protein S18 acetylase RimI-like enzyme